MLRPISILTQRRLPDVLKTCWAGWFGILNPSVEFGEYYTWTVRCQALFAK